MATLAEIEAEYHAVAATGTAEEARAFYAAQEAAFERCAAKTDGFNDVNRAIVYLRRRSPHDAPPVSVDSAATAKALLEQETPRFVRFGLLSRADFWARCGGKRQFAGSHSECAAVGLDKLLICSVGYRGEDVFELRHAGQDFELLAVIDHWCETSDESLKNWLDKNAGFASLARRGSSDMERDLSCLSLPVTPSVVSYLRYRMQGGGVSDCPPALKPRRGVRVVSFVLRGKCVTDIGIGDAAHVREPEITLAREVAEVHKNWAASVVGFTTRFLKRGRDGDIEARAFIRETNPTPVEFCVWWVARMEREQNRKLQQRELPSANRKARDYLAKQKRRGTITP